MGKQVSIKDVALRASTSIATVSRILNNVGYPVSDELRTRVEAAIRDLGYRPNRMAQNLRSKQTQSIGLIVRDISVSYFSLIAKGVTEEASSRGLMPLVCSSKRNPKLEIEYMRLLAQYQVAGVILAGASWEDPDYKKRMEETVADLRAQDVRVIGCAPQEVPMPCALVDNAGIGKQAFDVLHKYGHSHFAILGGEAANMSNRLRIQGFTQAADKKGATYKIAAGAFSWEHGHAALSAILAEDPAITAVYATNDHIALGALRYLEENGRSVPEEISVMGTGDVAVAPYTFPALSTIKMPFEELGSAAVKMIFDPNLGTDTVVPFKCSYVERESVGPRP
ncbi:putative HTH-type transcriptional regulator DegA [uncultured delta proteobacterium]|uniref:Putative HTH-type transcriptional regulator DegA n=1 Tax=uncultured delta proteobacterium TaxID=34034 RepID=A0A212JV14_9DELT|nr:putative HTH-type transcriptional regulator DegA [uncultured delta proteobacterium]